MLCRRRTARRKAKPSAAAQLAGAQRPMLRFGLHLVQGGGIEAGAKTLIDLRSACGRSALPRSTSISAAASMPPPCTR